jgi:hypothetical protein
MDAKIKNIRGQVTIFIIIAIIIVAVVLLFLVLRQNKNPEIDQKPGKNIGSFLDSCMKERLSETVNTIISQGGYIEPELYKEFLFSGDSTPTKIAYLCYNNKYYYPCVNQEPVLMTRIEEEIKEEIKTDVYDCFLSLGQSLKKEGYEIQSQHKEGDFEVSIEPGRVMIDVNAQITLTKTGETTIEKNFRIKFPTKLYELISVVQEALNKEAGSSNCDFDYVSYQTFYGDFRIEKNLGSNETEIYSITNKDTGEKFRFAVRGCVIPPGI